MKTLKIKIFKRVFCSFHVETLKLMINEKKIHLRKIQTLLKYKYTPFEKEKNTLHGYNSI